MGRTALVTGVAGQDGSYLAELLLARGTQVIGAVRDVARARAGLPASLRDAVQLVPLDLRDARAIGPLLERFKPAELYNCAGYSSGTGMYDDPAGIGEVNGIAVTHLLEAIRAAGGTTRFCQASSSEMFGETTESPQTESSPFRPRSPYGAAKLYGHAMVRIYRQRYGLFACSAILFNHESPRRGLGFVTRKVSHGAASIKLGLATELVLGNLDARRDWGFAGDTARAMWTMLQASEAGDYVVATGETHSVRDLCECAFGHLGLDYRAHVREQAADFRPAEAVQLVGDARRARARLGWAPEVGFRELVTMMVDADVELLRREPGAR
jgi:GDPmannose 4,6-dehydratase